MSFNIVEYDKERRVIYNNVITCDTEYFYNYNNSDMTITIKNYKNRSNFITVIKHKKQGEDYIKKSLYEEGDIYINEINYDDFGRETLIKRRNKIKDTKYYKEIIYRNKKGEPIFWITNYNGEKNFGFKVKIDKILR